MAKVLAPPMRDDVARVAAAFPLASNSRQLAKLTGLTQATVEAMLHDPEMAQDIDAFVCTMEAEGSLLKPLASKLLTKFLHKLGTDVEADQLDLDDISDLIPKLHRLVEHRDRMDAAHDDGRKLAVFNITIGASGIAALPVAAVMIEHFAPAPAVNLEPCSDIEGMPTHNPLSFLSSMQPLVPREVDDAAK